MQIHTSDNPAKDAGTHLSASINSHDGDVLCLLSGGSALDVVEYIEVKGPHWSATEKLPQRQSQKRGPTESQPTSAAPNDKRSECRTIFMMGDERVSREASLNNTSQLQNRYPGHFVTNHLLATIPEENETIENFATRIEKIFLQTISELTNIKIISLLGMGDDGHTAGIFPLNQVSFQETYREDRTYVPVHVEGLRIDFRASITPQWLLNHADELFGYVTGENKKKMTESLVNETKELHERPAELFKLHKQTHLFTDLNLCSQ